MAIAQNETIRIGINFVSPPFCFVHKNDSTGKFDTVGIDREIAKAIATKLKRSPRYIPVFGAGYRKQDLDSGKVDLVIAAFSITQERKKQKILFSHPYYSIANSLALLARPGTGIKRDTDLKGKRYGFVIGSISHDYVSQNLRQRFLQDKDTIGIAIGVEDQRTLMKMLLDSEVDAIIDDFHLLDHWHKYYPDYNFITLGRSVKDEYGIGIGPKYNSKKYVDQINEVVDSIYNRDRELKARIDLFKTLSPNPEFLPSQKKIVIISILGSLPIMGLIGLIIIGIRDEQKEKAVQEKERAVIKNNYEKRRQQQGGKPITFCLIIANSKYQTANLGKYPYEDADEIKKSLLQYGFVDDDIFIFKDATRKGIIKTFQDLVTRSENSLIKYNSYTKDIDKLLIYYSGHGHMISLPGSTTGYWKPIDGNESWDFIPDYEIMHYVSSMNFSQVLLVSDSCFSGTLIQPANKQFASAAGSCIDVITAGNSRVPVNSKFREAFTNVLNSNKNSLLTSKEIYGAIAGQLTNDVYYQPQFGSKCIDDLFTFSKFNPGSTDDVTEMDIERILSVFGEQRILDEKYLHTKSSLTDEKFGATIQEMINRNLVSRLNGKIIRIVQY